MGRHSAAEDREDLTDPALPAVPRGHGPDRPDSLTSTGTHRAVGRSASRRGIAAWPIACLVLVGLLVAGWFGWNWADGVVESRAEAQATSCQEGDATLRVVVDPGAQHPVSVAAARWNQARTVVRGHCVTVDVHAAPEDRMLAVLFGDAGPDTVGGWPAAWLPKSASSIEQLESERPERIGSQAESVASDGTDGTDGDYPYVGLTGEGVDDVQERAAQSFRAYLLQPAQQADFAAAGLAAADAPGSG
ncbi:hypothetical protein [Qaidamihabitans albus]|uniref:hypothetical protein n=1 Tax=Qaidamihabitans albus TaxID=2795733 RepID=UPI001F188F54|nr:hypothetical protein [Qaidamihabitans albus]